MEGHCGELQCTLYIVPLRQHTQLEKIGENLNCSEYLLMGRNESHILLMFQ